MTLLEPGSTHWFSDKDSESSRVKKFYGPFEDEETARAWNSVHRNISETESWLGVQIYDPDSIRYVTSYPEECGVEAFLFLSPEEAQYPIRGGDPQNPEWGFVHDDWAEFVEESTLPRIRRMKGL